MFIVHTLYHIQGRHNCNCGYMAPTRDKNVHLGDTEGYKDTGKNQGYSTKVVAAE